MIDLKLSWIVLLVGLDYYGDAFIVQKFLKTTIDIGHQKEINEILFWDILSKSSLTSQAFYFHRVKDFRFVWCKYDNHGCLRFSCIPCISMLLYHLSLHLPLKCLVYFSRNDSSMQWTSLCLILKLQNQFLYGCLWSVLCTFIGIILVCHEHELMLHVVFRFSVHKTILLYHLSLCLHLKCLCLL